MVKADEAQKAAAAEAARQDELKRRVMQQLADEVLSDAVNEAIRDVASEQHRLKRKNRQT